MNVYIILLCSSILINFGQSLDTLSIDDRCHQLEKCESEQQVAHSAHNSQESSTVQCCSAKTLHECLLKNAPSGECRQTIKNLTMTENSSCDFEKLKCPKSLSTLTTGGAVCVMFIVINVLLV